MGNLVNLQFYLIGDRRDQKTLERLRAERQAKIDELKEKTNYYSTQQLIQRYDPDPAAKAAAATVLASKLGADSGLKVYVGDESMLNVPGGKSNDVEVVPSSGLRKRKQVHARSSSTGSTPLLHSDEETPHSAGNVGPRASEHDQLVVDHYYAHGPSTQDGGWLARIAALLVGEDPTQSYALICNNCHMHNGLARKEDVPYITYYCPHCHALNRPKPLEEHVSSSSPTSMNPSKSEGTGDAIKNSSGSMGSSPTSMNPSESEGTGDAIKISSGSMDESVITSNSPVRSGSEIEEVTEKVVSRDLVG
ncbi:hypothetical protein CRYUN_Cryun02cG0078100 [Craigia yunnanensis]